MDSRSKYSEETEKNVHNELYKESGVCNTASENLYSNLPRNKPGYGEKAFTYLEGDVLFTVLDKSCSLRNELHLNSNSVDNKNVCSEKISKESVLNSNDNFFRDDSGFDKESNESSEIKTLNILLPVAPKPAYCFQDTRMQNSHRMPNAVRVLPQCDPDSRKYIKKSRSLTENDNIRHIPKGVVPQFLRPPSLPRSTSAPALPPRNTNRNTKDGFRDPVLHCDVISETNDFKHHIYEEIDEVIKNVASLNDSKTSVQSVHATNQSQLEHCSISVLDTPEDGVGSSQLDIAEKLTITEENDDTKCAIISRNHKLRNISPNPAFQAEITSKVQKRFREERSQTKTPFAPNSDLDSSLTRVKPATSRDGITNLETASVRNMINTFEQSIFSVDKGESTRKVPGFTHEAKNDGNISERTGRNCPEMNITEENINTFEKFKSRYNENKGFSEKFEDPNMLSIQQSESCQGKTMTRVSENQRTESNEFRLENTEDKRNLDEAWMNNINRPLLPIKNIHKQKSLSCTNLLQTFKGFSKRNSSDNTKFLLVETTEKTVEEKRENCTSEASISKDDKAKDFLTDVQPLHESNLVESPETKNYAWFHQVNARESTKKLLSLEQDGAFLVRPASNPSKKTRYTLCVSYANIVYNMHIRDLQNGLIALGEKKEKEKTFSSFLEMIRYHQDVPIRIRIVQPGQIAHIYLLITPPK